MDATVQQVVSACMPCARTKAGFRVSGKELQPYIYKALCLGGELILRDHYPLQKEEIHLC